jgi:hypothetical protein
MPSPKAQVTLIRLGLLAAQDLAASVVLELELATEPKVALDRG